MSKTLMAYREYFYYNGAYTRVLQPSQNPNPDLKWETKYETNVGLDFSVLKNRVSGAIDYYDRTTKDMLWEYPVPSPPYKTRTLLMNVGEMNSTGIEVLVNIVPVQTKDFSWTSTILYSRNKNKLVSLSNDKYKAASYQSIGGLGAPLWGNTQRIYAGQELGQFYAYHLLGIEVGTDSSSWLVENSLGDTIYAQDAKDSSDMRMIGSGIPKYFLGWNNTFKYKNFDLSITTRGAFGHKVLNMTKMYYSNLLKTPNYLKSAFEPVLGTVLPDNLGPQYLDYYIEDGSYYKIDNITLGYNFKLEKNSYLKSARIYISGSNLYTFTSYTGQDPETETNLDFKWGVAPGLDPREKYPTTRTYTVGINVVF
jgi:TonB-dependent starch-binding outer membrane protein SusC